MQGRHVEHPAIRGKKSDHDPALHADKTHVFESELQLAVRYARRLVMNIYT